MKRLILMVTAVAVGAVTSRRRMQAAAADRALWAEVTDAVPPR